MIWIRNFAWVLIFFGTPVYAKTFKIGVILRFDDQYNLSVINLDRGISTAFKLFKKQNSKISIEVKRFSHGDSLESVQTAVKKALLDKVDLVIGGELSTEAEVIARLLQDKQIPFITPTASHPSVSEKRPHVFQVCFSDKQVAQKLAHFTVSKLGAKKIAVIQNVSFPYSKFLGDEFFDAAKSFENVTVIKERFVGKQNDFTPIIKKLKDSFYTHVSMLNYLSDLFAFSSQAAELNYFPVYIGSDGWGESKAVHHRLSKPSKNFIGFQNTYWDKVLRTKISKDFDSEFRATYNSPPEDWSAISFDAAWISLNAIKRLASATNPQSLIDAVMSTKNLPLVTSESFSFDKDGITNKKIFIYKISERGVEQQEPQ